MSTSGISSSREKLDEMLQAGKLTEKEHTRLLKAVAPKPGANGYGAKGLGVNRSKLYKNWRAGRIGGLCAGIGNYTGLDPNVVRVLFLGSAVSLTFIGGGGIVLFLLYFVFCALIPWDEEEIATEFRKRGRPALFASLTICLFGLIPLLYSLWIIPELSTIYEETGPNVSSAEFQRTLAGRAFDCASEYILWLRFDDGALFVGLAVAAAVAGIPLLIYTGLCRAAARRAVLVIMLGSGVSWLTFLIGGTLAPLMS